METPIWTGEIRKCRYCRDGVFPHGHEPRSLPEDDEPAPKKKAAVKKSRKADTVAKITSGRRGRPMTAENWDLLRLCECV